MKTVYTKIVLFAWFGLVAGQSQTFAINPPDAVPAHKIRIALIGDSTMTDNAGWGLGFKQFLDPDKVELLNLSRGGRSSLSYMKEGRWTNALAQHADYYLIQFGHNNEPGKPGRSTDMATFIANMKQYVDDARAIGAKPILVTPMTRRQWDPDHPGKIKSSLAPYAVEVRKIAVEKNVPLVDLQARSIELCESLGPKKCQDFSPVKVVDGKPAYDGTHLNIKGYVMFARLVVNELHANVPELNPCLLDKPLKEYPVPAEAAYDAIVSADGSGTFTTIQDAIAAVPDNGTNWFSIFVEPGVYQGQFMVPKQKRHIRIIGEEGEITNTVLAWPYNVNEPQPGLTYQFNPGMVIAGSDFYAANLTIENTSGDHGQALALRVDGDRDIFNHCRILGWQDTLMINNGRDYFTNCYVAGRVDFIYGSATAVFDHCEIHSRNGGHVTAASTPQSQPYGFVFLQCHLTGDSQPWINPTNPAANTMTNTVYADLGRPWRPYASVTYVNCEMDAHIRPAGWNNWGKVANESTARYAEYNSTGPGANPDQRATWIKQLTEDDVKSLTTKAILSGADGWDPEINL
ncbi:MAG TPA: pectinesterase family protein [Verrucomicrobiae bacterium]